MNDHLVEIFGQHADFVVAMDVDRLVQIAGFADLVRHFNQMVQRLFD